MRSTVKGSNYVVCMEDNRYPEKLSVKKTDTQLNKLYSLLNAVAELGDKITKVFSTEIWNWIMTGISGQLTAFCTT